MPRRVSSIASKAKHMYMSCLHRKTKPGQAESRQAFFIRHGLSSCSEAHSPPRLGNSMCTTNGHLAVNVNVAKLSARCVVEDGISVNP